MSKEGKALLGNWGGVKGFEKKETSSKRRNISKVIIAANGDIITPGKKNNFKKKASYKETEIRNKLLNMLRLKIILIIFIDFHFLYHILMNICVILNIKMINFM